jgi:hypothetical protein
VTDDRCLAPGCQATGVRCDYVDRHQRRCRTAWCARHWIAFSGEVFCRRHASVVAATHRGAAAGGLPEVDNRAASLVGWVAGQIDERVRTVLRHAAPEGGAVLVADPVGPLAAHGREHRRWQRAWKLVDHTGVLCRVAIEVDEGNDTDVIAKVDAEIVGHGVPPWIEVRAQGQSISPAADVEQRREFYEAIARSIELVVTRQEVVAA